MIEKVIDHLRNREYMSGVERDKSRTRATGEVFTPTELVRKILDRKPSTEFTDPAKTFIDPSCGDGQFLSEVIIKKMENGSTYTQALSTTYGVDLQEDNCMECIRRLYGANGDIIIEPLHDDDIDVNWHRTGVKAVFRVTSNDFNGIANIVCANALEYDYSFGETPEGEALFIVG
jgi:hypothetical protein